MCKGSTRQQKTTRPPEGDAIGVIKLMIGVSHLHISFERFLARLCIISMNSLAGTTHMTCASVKHLPGVWWRRDLFQQGSWGRLILSEGYCHWCHPILGTVVLGTQLHLFPAKSLMALTMPITNFVAEAELLQCDNAFWACSKTRRPLLRFW